jgi:hypothetical protein
MVDAVEAAVFAFRSKSVSPVVAFSTAADNVANRVSAANSATLQVRVAVLLGDGEAVSVGEAVWLPAFGELNPPMLNPPIKRASTANPISAPLPTSLM